jgi:uncharacterized protein (DUF1684 family)
MMKERKIISVLLVTGIFLLVLGAPIMGAPIMAGSEEQKEMTAEEQQVLEWRKERDAFFRNHQRSPLLPQDKKDFKGLAYYPFDPKYFFSGEIERFIFHINNPRYYATFLTNKGLNKRYIRYGKFSFQLSGKGYSIEIYKSLLSDMLFIPFKDKTNGRETYDGGRYIDAEILPGYKVVLDFNMAYHPPCAYNEKFTCVLPPRENILDIEIRAGEKNFK